MMRNTLLLTFAFVALLPSATAIELGGIRVAEGHELLGASAGDADVSVAANAESVPYVTVYARAEDTHVMAAAAAAPGAAILMADAQLDGEQAASAAALAHPTGANARVQALDQDPLHVDVPPETEGIWDRIKHFLSDLF